MLMAPSSGNDPWTAPVSALEAPALQQHGPGDPHRAEVEQFIRQVYARRYGACVRAFAPVLVSLRDPADSAIVAAAGYRHGGQGPLYLERYLDASIDCVLASHAGSTPARSHVVEIAHLCATRAGAGRALMFLLGPHLAQQDFAWVVCTLTQELRHLIVRLGITPLALAKADPAALGVDEAADWGSYYDHQPVVLAGELRPSLRRLARRGRVAGAVHAR